MSMFERMDRITSRVVDRTFAVGFECHPAASTPNGRPGPDPERPIWFGKGAFDELPKYDAVEIGKRDRAGNDLKTLITGMQFELSVDRHRYADAADTRQGDQIQLDDLRTFEVAVIQPDGLSRIVFGLVAFK